MAKQPQIPHVANQVHYAAMQKQACHQRLIRRNRRILADQMEFLMAHLPKTSRLHA